jgi:hypothetical protein
LPLSYTLCCLHDSPVVQSHVSGIDLPAYHEPLPVSSAANPTYLITPRVQAVVLRPIPHESGGKSYAVDQLENPDSITFTPGGRHTTGPLISGRIATASDTPTAKRLYSKFQGALQRDFVRVQAYLVGPEALRLLRSGVRLTIDASSHQDFDLRSPSVA